MNKTLEEIAREAAVQTFTDQHPNVSREVDRREHIILTALKAANAEAEKDRARSYEPKGADLHVRIALSCLEELEPEAMARKARMVRNFNEHSERESQLSAARVSLDRALDILVPSAPSPASPSLQPTAQEEVNGLERGPGKRDFDLLVAARDRHIQLFNDEQEKRMSLQVACANLMQMCDELRAVCSKQTPEQRAQALEDARIFIEGMPTEIEASMGATTKLAVATSPTTQPEKHPDTVRLDFVDRRGAEIGYDDGAGDGPGSWSISYFSGNRNDRNKKGFTCGELREAIDAAIHSAKPAVIPKPSNTQEETS